MTDDDVDDDVNTWMLKESSSSQKKKLKTIQKKNCSRMEHSMSILGVYVVCIVNIYIFILFILYIGKKIFLMQTHSVKSV